MAYPPRPSRRTSYTQAANAGLAFSNANLDAEHNDFVEQIDQLNTLVRGVTTASGTLKNLATATAQALAGSQRFVATAAQATFDTTIAYVAAFNSLNVDVAAAGLDIDPNLVTVSNNAGFLRVVIPAQALNTVVQVQAFESGAGVLTRLSNTASGADGANMIGVQDTGALIAATTVEGALAEIVTSLNTYIALVGNVAELFKRNGSVAATGDFAMGAHKITGLLDGVASTDAATVAQVNTASATLATLANSFIKRDGTNSPSADVSWNSKKITNLATPTASTDAVTKGYVDTIGAAATPTGAVSAYAGGTAPTGWLLCDGAAVSRVTYALLFAVVGTTYGPGDGATTFNTPDVRGRTLLGVGTGAGGGTSGSGIVTGGSALTTRTAGQWFGEELHTMTAAELVAHTHVYRWGIAAGAGPGPDGEAPIGNNTNSASTDSTGTTSPFNVVQPGLALNYIIKTGL